MVSFYTDPDPEFEKICYGSGFRPNFDTDLDTNPDKLYGFGKKRIQYQEDIQILIL